MSPEQLEGETVDGRSDIFSLGVTFYQLLTGELPFAATSLSSLMYKIANQQHEDVRSVRPELPECVSQIINTALNKDMGQRFPRAGLMASVVRRCMQRLVDINTPHTDASLKMNIIQSSR
jgi:serine/threonine-protein kinase